MSRKPALLACLAISLCAAAPRAKFNDLRQDKVDALVRQLQSSGKYQSVRIAWRRRDGRNGPYAIVEGVWGGSAGLVDLYAPYGSGPKQLQMLTLAKADDLIIQAPNGHLALEAPFVIEFFNGASNASATSVPLPVVWRGDNFRLDLSALTSRMFDAQDLRFRRIAVCYELNEWAGNLNDPSPLYPAPPNALGGTPITLQALTDLMLTGHAQEAKAVLHQCWPRSLHRTDIRLEGEQTFWNDLSNALKGNPLWTRFDLGRLPDASLIEFTPASTAVPAS